MKVVYLHQYFNTPEMAGGTRSFEISRRLVAAGHEVDIITSWRAADSRRGWSTTMESGVRVHWLAVPYRNAMSFLWRIAAFLRFAWGASLKAATTDADVILATSTPLTIAIPAMLASRWRRIPFVFEVRDMWPDVPVALGVLRNPLLIAAARWLEQRTYMEAREIIVLAPGMATDIVAKGVPADKISVIPNGCSFELFEGTPTDVRAEHAWLGDRKLVIYAGAMGDANGVTYLPRLAARVAVRDPEIRFVIFGDGRQRDTVKRVAEEEGVLGRTLFLFDPVAKRELAAWLRAADLHVALMTGPEVYLKDAVNNKFFDALAVGRPIANNFDGWQTRIAADAEIGVYLHPHDLDIAAESLVRALRDEVWCAESGERASALARDSFNFDRLAAEVCTVLERAVQCAGDIQ